jgi:hypothetical protein
VPEGQSVGVNDPKGQKLPAGQVRHDAGPAYKPAGQSEALKGMDALDDDDGVALAVGDREGVALLVGDSEGVALAVGDSEGVALAVGDSEGANDAPDEG